MPKIRRGTGGNQCTNNYYHMLNPNHHIVWKGKAMRNSRPDRAGPHRTSYERNKKIILRTQNTCGICGRPVDLHLKTPDPLSPVIDHIIPISKGGHPSDIDNLQLAHWSCNRQKSDKIFNSSQKETQVLGNRNLPQTISWANYKA